MLVYAVCSAGTDSLSVINANAWLHQVSIAAMILGEFMVSFEQYLC
jgi:hypothetical protein